MLTADSCTLSASAAEIPAPIVYIKVVKTRSWISVEDDRSALWVSGSALTSF